MKNQSKTLMASKTNTVHLISQKIYQNETCRKHSLKQHCENTDIENDLPGQNTRNQPPFQRKSNRKQNQQKVRSVPSNQTIGKMEKSTKIFC